MFKSIAIFFLAAIAAAAQAQTTAPVLNDLAINASNGMGGLQTRYISTDKTGRLQVMMFGQDPTPGAPVGQLRVQQRTLGASIVCGPLGGDTCDVVATAMSIYSTQIADSTAMGRSILTSTDATAARLTMGAGTSSFDGSYTSLSNVPPTFSPSTHSQPSSTISDSTSAGRAILTAADASAMRSLMNIPSVAEVAAGYYPLASNPAAYLTSSALSPYLTTAAAASTYATSAGVTSSLAAKQNAITLTSTGTGTASLVGSTLNIPTPSAAAPFNFSQPTARTLAVSTSYQALDTTKATIITPSYACQNATQVLASSACTVQVRMGTGTLTCSTGTVYYTQSLTVSLGVLLTQSSINPVQINLPIGASFVLCPVSGTFTTTTVEQSAG